MTPDQSPTSFQQLWLCETIRLREEQAGLLEDDAITRQVRAEGGDLPQRIASRALHLARRDQQWQALLHWQQGARLAAVALMAVALISGFGLGVAALGDGQRPVNVFWALGTLLGINWLMLLGWIAALWLGDGEASALGRLWLWLSGKLARDAKSAQLAPALLYLLRRHSRWGFGVLAHGCWALAMLAALTALLMLMATRRYGFVWETTILGGDTFVAITQGLGALPALLGFSVPDEALIHATGDTLRLDEPARHAWASWLAGVVVVYGLLPRLLLLLVCGWRWLSGVKQLQLDLDLPGYQWLAARLMPSSEQLGVTDAEPDLLFQPRAGHGDTASGDALLVGVELDPQQHWPPMALPAAVVDGGVIDSREQRRQLLDQLSRYPVQRLVLACDPRRSPDRGTLALLSELAGYAVQTRIWLLSAPAQQKLDRERLDNWRDALARAELRECDGPPERWLEQGGELGGKENGERGAAND